MLTFLKSYMFESIVAINSKDRYNGTSSDFNYQLIQFGKSKVVSYRVNKVSIPYSYYNTRAQTFRISVDGGAYSIINLPAGSYTQITLINQLLALINPTIAFPLTISFDSNTNKYIMSIASPHTFALDFAFTTVPANYNVGNQMGFGLVANTQLQIHTSDFPANLNATVNLYIFSNSLSTFVNGYFQKNRSSIIQTIPIQVNSFSYIVWENLQPTNFMFDDKSVNGLDLQILDDFGNIVDLNNQNWTLELQLYSTSGF